MCGSMVDIQSTTAENRRGKKIEVRKKKPQNENIMCASATQGGHKKRTKSMKTLEDGNRNRKHAYDMQTRKQHLY